VPALVPAAARIRREQHTTRTQRVMELGEHARELLARHVKKGRIREHAVKTLGGQIEREKILVQHLAAGSGARHRDELRRPVGAEPLRHDRGIARAADCPKLARSLRERYPRERRFRSMRATPSLRQQLARHASVAALGMTAALGVFVLLTLTTRTAAFDPCTL